MVEIRSGNQHSRSANRNWFTNSPPYGYGGRSADMTVLPVRIIMSPTCSSRFLVGRNARSAAARTTLLSSLLGRASGGADWRLESVRHSLDGCQPATVQARRPLPLTGLTPWYVPAALGRMPAHRLTHAGVASLGIAALAATGCGQGER